MNFRLDGLQLLHQFLVNVQTTSRIDDDNIVGMRVGKSNGTLGNRHRISSRLHRKHRKVQLLTQYLQLFYSRRAVNIRCDQYRTLALLLERKPKLSGRSGFTCALQAHHHDDRRWNR